MMPAMTTPQAPQPANLYRLEAARRRFLVSERLLAAWASVYLPETDGPVRAYLDDLHALQVMLAPGTEPLKPSPQDIEWLIAWYEVDAG